MAPLKPHAMCIPYITQDPNATQPPDMMCIYTPIHCLPPIKTLVSQFNDEANTEHSDVPPLTCIVTDGLMSFALKVAQQFDIPKVLFWTTSACGLLGYSQYGQLIERGYIPLKDENQSSGRRNHPMITTISTALSNWKINPYL
ncbi:hypothetical protein POM88_043705 [Heracleum sosnowskyi]|uniref:UDP-glucosyltransferase n=1 Tax=Heracleum sosnowskyi TaxID=360622 RepID=A0AAD8H449_9APIA|nr:hypothetical protein POM88_043705 [Heracleum sosnowskyi]